MRDSFNSGHTVDEQRARNRGAFRRLIEASTLSSPLSLSLSMTLALTLSALTLSGCGGSAASTASVSPPVSVTPPPPPPPVVQRPETPAAAPAGPDYHPTGQGWVLKWSDEFEGTSLDTEKWAVEEACWGGGNDEKQCYTNRTDNVDVVNGLLRLIALEETFTGPNRPDDATQKTQPYTSGKILSKGLADWTYGRFEFRAKLPEGQGAWPAFWMLAATETYGNLWPMSGEIDIMEAVNLGARCDNCTGNDGENRSSGALHFGSEWPNNQFVSDKTTLADNTNPADGYHVWAVEWGEGTIHWYLNGERFAVRNNSDWYTDAAPNNANAPFDAAFYLILNLAIGGNYPEPLNATGIADSTLPNQFLVDWVRVYQCDADLEKGLACMAAP
jgi:beta-glucanase (GH16 family)